MQRKMPPLASTNAGKSQTPASHSSGGQWPLTGNVAHEPANGKTKREEEGGKKKQSFSVVVYSSNLRGDELRVGVLKAGGERTKG